MEEQRRKEEAEKREREMGKSAPSPGQVPQTTPPPPPPPPPLPPSSQAPVSPQTTVEDQSLQKTMDKNKESLKRKLLLRRSVTELVDQGIYPPLTAPAAYAEQRKQLERAKTGDLLRHKLRMRPDRQSLVQHHILEDTNVDPSLQDRQKLLKKAKLQDNLNDRLAKRPGPLELVEGNILQTDPELKDAIIEGKLQFPKTSELTESAVRTQFKEEPEDVCGSEEASSPGQSDIFSDAAMSPVTIPPPPDIVPFIQSLQQSGVLSPSQTLTLSQISAGTSASSLASASSLSSMSAATLDSVRFTNAMSPPLFSSSSSTSSQGSNSGSNSRLAKVKKKPAKTPPKRVIKFHEYKGPPNLVKNQPSPPPTSGSSSETPYHILLQQQQLLLQWQLETRQPRNLPIFLSTAQKQILTPTTSGSSPTESTIIQAPQVQVQQVEQSAAASVQAMTPVSQAHLQKVTQKPPGKIITPVGTPVPITTPSPVPAPSIAPPPTIVASIPAAVPANAIPTYRPLATVASVNPIVTTFVKTLVTSPPVTVTSDVKVNTDGMASKDGSKFVNNNTYKNSTVHCSSRMPVTKLDDLKVAELRAECRKRSLPVSGPKPNLLEKLKPFADEIVAEYKSNHKGEVAKSTSSISSVSSLSGSHSDNSLTSPPSVQSITNINNLINIQPLTPVNDTVVSMNLGSPPMSPDTSVPELTASSVSSQKSQPMSPDMATDALSPASSLANQQVTKNQLNSSQTNVPMAVDQRPPSVVPMDVDTTSSRSTVSASSMGHHPKQVPSPSTSKTSVGPTVTTASMALVKSPSGIQPPPLPPNTQVITIRPQTGTAPAQIQLQGPLPNTGLSAQIQAQLLQQITAHMVRIPTSQVVNTLPVVGQPASGAIAIAQPRPMLTQLSQAASVTKTVTVVPQPHNIFQASNPANQLMKSVQHATGQPMPVGVSISAVSLPQVTPQLAIPRMLQPHVSVTQVNVADKQRVAQQIGQPAVMSNEELLRQQQKKIEDMSKQLLQYRLQIQQQNEQLQGKSNLALTHIQGPEQNKGQQVLAMKQGSSITQIQVQTAGQLSSQPQANSLVSIQAPVQLQAQIQAQQQQQQSKTIQTPNSSLAGQNQMLTKQIQLQSPGQMSIQNQLQAQPVLVQQASVLATNQRNATPQNQSHKTAILTQVQLQQLQNAGQSVSPSQVVVSQGIQPQTTSGNSVAKSDVKPIAINSIVQGQALPQSLNLGQHKVLFTAIQPSGHQLLVSSQPSGQGLIIQQGIAATSQAASIGGGKPGRHSPVTLNGITTSTNNK
ncbi:hypothetical protein LSH36_205g02000 [Paralvinella palmiformis]|uniref:SAP domain-containing protein n=1 Tax=Paralvinella palmiformis TaxID=53620 RepID=A0AAD9N4F9_9ANNE|nr:hypothetical protein LSH36_205g02000 [Paralvinella palmiformis]